MTSWGHFCPPCPVGALAPPMRPLSTHLLLVTCHRYLGGWPLLAPSHCSPGNTFQLMMGSRALGGRGERFLGGLGKLICPLGLCVLICKTDRFSIGFLYFFLHLLFFYSPSLLLKDSVKKINTYLSYLGIGLPCWLNGKESACNAGDTGSIPGSKRSPGEGNGNLGILAWRIRWTEEPGRLWSIESQSQTQLSEHTQHPPSVRLGVKAGYAQEMASKEHPPHTLVKNEQACMSLAVTDPRRGCPSPGAAPRIVGTARPSSRSPGTRHWKALGCQCAGVSSSSSELRDHGTPCPRRPGFADRSWWRERQPWGPGNTVTAA